MPQYLPQIFIKLFSPVLFVFRGKSAKLEQPVVRCVSKTVPPGTLLKKNPDALILIRASACVKVLSRSVGGQWEHLTTSKWMIASQSTR